MLAGPADYRRPKVAAATPSIDRRTCIQERFLSRDFVWELEKLRRRFGVDGDELRAAAKQLHRKRRGVKPYNDDKYLSKVRDGASVLEVARSVGGGGAHAAEIRITRKNRKLKLEAHYWRIIEDFVDLFVMIPTQKRYIYAKRLRTVGPPSAPHLIELDIAGRCLERASATDSLAEDDRDRVEAARFYPTMIHNIDRDVPARFEGLGERIDALKAIYEELRVEIT